MCAKQGIFNIESVADLELLTEHYRERETAGDTELILDGHNYMCHEAIIRKSSAFLDDFYGNLKTNKSFPRYNFVNKKTANIFIRSLYYQPLVNVEPSVFQDMVNICDSWKLPAILEKCKTYMSKPKTIAEAVTYFSLAIEHKLGDLGTKLSFFIRENFQQMQKEICTCKWTVEKFCEIVKSQEIQVDSEDLVFKCAVAVVHLSKNSGNVIKVLSDLLHVECITDNVISEVNKSFEPLGRPEEVGELIKFVVDERKKRPLENNHKRIWKKNIIAINNDNKIMKFKSEDNTAHCFNNLPSFYGFNSDLCFCDKWLLIFHSPNLHRLNIENESPNRNVWEKLSVITELDETFVVGEEPGMAFFDNKVYISAGSAAEQQFYSMDIESGKVTVLQSMLHKPGGEQLSIYFNGEIYIFGGNVYCNVAMKYAIHKNTWKSLPDLPQNVTKRFSGAVGYQEKIMVFTRTVGMIYNAQNDHWDVFQFSMIGDTIQLFIYNNQLCASVVRTETGAIKQFDWGSKTWTKILTEVKDLKPKACFPRPI